MKTILRFVGLFLNFLTPYSGNFIFYGKAFDYFRFVFTAVFIVVLALFDHAFVTRNSTAPDVIFFIGFLIVVSLFINSVHVLIKSENEFDFYWFDFVGRIVLVALPYTASALILGELD